MIPTCTPDMPAPRPGGGHFSVRVTSSRFRGHSTLQRHRLVYQAVDDMMPGEIHALSIKARTPEEETPAEYLGSE